MEHIAIDSWISSFIRDLEHQVILQQTRPPLLLTQQFLHPYALAPAAWGDRACSELRPPLRSSWGSEA